MKKKKVIFGFIDPKMIMAVVVSLMLLSVGAFAFFTTWSALEEVPQFAVSGTECTTISIPTNNESVTIPIDATISRVYEVLNTGGTQTIDSGNYTLNDSTWVVLANVTG